MKINPTIHLWGLVSATGAVLTVLSVAAFAGGLAWNLDLLAHFRVQYSVVLFVTAGVLALGRRWRGATVAGCGFVLNLAAIGPYFCGGGSALRADAPRLRLALVNVNTANNRFDLVREFVRLADADIVAIQEVNAKWLTELAGLRARYPHVVTETREDNFGIALFSRLPLTRGDVVHLGAVQTPSIRVEFDLGGQPVSLLTTHPVPPRSGTGTVLRNEQLAAIAHDWGASPGRRILLGDLNTSPWSAAFRQFTRTTGLRDSALGRGVQPSWPTSLWWLRVPIDHCLISPEFAVADRHVGPAVGSDHFPIVVELAAIH